MVHALLTEANGFANVSEQYEECKDIILKIVDEIKDTAQRWKVGFVVLLSRVICIGCTRIIENTIQKPVSRCNREDCGGCIISSYG